MYSESTNNNDKYMQCMWLVASTGLRAHPENQTRALSTANIVVVNFA
jgi:hypothetical protein